MSVSRRQHSATLLGNGNVLVAGGQTAVDENGNPTNITATAEIYVPRTNTWLPAASMTYARAGHNAVLLKGRKVLVVGGFGLNGEAVPPELYTPWTNSWALAAPTLLSRIGSTATLLTNGKVLVVGGDGGTDPCYTPELYTPWTNTWAFGPVNPNAVVPCQRHSAVRMLNGRVLVHGGIDSQGAGFTPSYEFRPFVGSWFGPIQPSPIEHLGQAMTLLASGKVLLAGGGCRLCPGGNQETWLYDPITSSWALTGSMTYFRQSNVLVSIPGGRALVLGTGFLDVFDDATINRASAEVFDSASGTWTVAADMHVPRDFGFTATLLPDGRVLVAGGSGVQGLTASAELFSG